MVLPHKREQSRSRWLLVLGMVLVPLSLFAIAFASRALASQPLAATVTGPSSSNASTVLHIESETCVDASSSISGAVSGTTYTLPVGPSGFPSITSMKLILSDSCASSNTLTLEGPVTVFGLSADMVVLGQWTGATDTSPIFTIFFKFTDTSLSHLVSSTALSNVDVEMSSAWVSVTTSASDVGIAASSLPSGYLATDMTVHAQGVTFRGLLSASGDLATALGDVGVSPSGIQLDGNLTASIGNLSTSAPPAVSTGLSLTASVDLNLPSTPTWLSVTNPFTLTIVGQSGAGWSVTASGGASVDIPDTTGQPTSVTASIAISKDAGKLQLDLSASLGTLDGAFGQSWLKMDNTELDWSISAGGTTATLSATATVANDAYTVTLTLGTDGASVDLSTSATLDVKTLASDLGLASWPSKAPDMSVSNLDVYLQVPTSGGITVAVTGTVNIIVGGNSYGANLLVRDQLGANGSKGSLLVAASPSSAFTLNGLLGLKAVSPDIPLPNVSIVFSTTDFKEASSALDPPTETYFQNLLCPGGTACAFTVDAPAGVGIEASVTVPQQLGQMFCTLLGEGSSCTDPFSGPVTIDGQIPLFGGTTTSLTVSLPPVTVHAGPVQQISADLSISESGGTFSMSLGGTMVLLAPGSSASTTCPTGVSAPSGDVCLDLSLSGQLSAGTSGVSVQITGQLSTDGTSGWTLPSPVSWLTVDDVAVQVGVTAGEGAGVTLGAYGKVEIGSTDLELGVDMEVTANAPWVNLLGFSVGSHSGMSLSDLGHLYEDVSGQSLPTTSLPPLAVQNLYLSYSSVSDPALCLQPGLYISGDLVLTNTGSSSVGGSTPQGQANDCTTPNPSDNCSADSTSCLASIFLSVSPSGIVGEGHLAGFTAGPLQFQPTDLSFTLDSTEVQVGISGGGTLLDPVRWANGTCPSGTTDATCIWASGNIDLQVGTVDLSLTGNVQIGDLSASISGTGSFDLSNPGFNISDFFDTVKQAFVTAGNDITSSMDTVANTADAWYATYVAPGIAGLETDVTDAYGALNSSGPQSWQDFVNLYGSISSQINSFNNAVNKAKLNFLDIPTDAIFWDALHGISFPSAQVCFGKLGCITVWNGFNIPGLCAYDTNIKGTPVCDAPSISDVVAAVQQQYAKHSVDNQLSGAKLSLPPNATESSTVQTIHLLDPPAPSSVTCATASENYAPGAATPESPTTMRVDSLGNSVTISGPKPGDFGQSTQQTANDQTLSQNTLDGLYGGQNNGSCGAPTTPSQPSLSLSLDKSWIDEGGTVTASGYLENSSDSTVSIDWGDGSTPTTATVQPDGSYSATHNYADETGSPADTQSPFTVTASAAGVRSATQQIRVLDAPLQLVPNSLNVTPATVDVMKTVTVTGTIANPETGEPTTAVVGWGDGTAQTTVAVGSDGRFSATHVYERLVPSGAPSREEPITVTVSESDGTSIEAPLSVTVDDVAPSGTNLSPVSGASVYDNTVFTHAGTSTTWAAQVFDVSPEQVLSFDTNWADGTPDNLVTVNAPTSGPNLQSLYTYAVPSGSVQHTYASPCLYHVMTTVTDDDTLSAPPLPTPVVATAPLGAAATGTGYWLQQVDAALGHDRGGQVSAPTVGCYLAIAQYLSPELAQNLTPPELTPSAAAGILRPDLGHMSAAQKTKARLEQLLLTSLMNFSNGTWDWTQGIGPAGATYSSMVAQANAALSSGSPAAMQSALAAFERLPT